jgi:hypothetical protein
MSQFKSPSHKLLFSARQGREKWKQKAMSNRDKLRNEELKKNIIMIALLLKEK